VHARQEAYQGNNDYLSLAQAHDLTTDIAAARATVPVAQGQD